MNIATFDSNYFLNIERSEPTHSGAIIWWMIVAIVLHIGLLVLIEYFKTQEPEMNRQRSFDVALRLESQTAVETKNTLQQIEPEQPQQPAQKVRESAKHQPSTKQSEKVEQKTKTEQERKIEQKPGSSVQSERAKPLLNSKPKPFIIPSYQENEKQVFTDPLNPNPTKGTLSQSVMLNTDALAVAKKYVDMLDEEQELKAEAFDTENIFQSEDNMGNFEFSSQKFADGSLGVQVKNFGKKTCFRVEQSLSMDAFQDQQRWYIVPCG